MKFYFLIALIVTLVTLVKSVDRSKFRKCSDTGFCRRYRNQFQSLQNQFSIDATTLKQVNQYQFVVSASSQSLAKPLNLEVSALASGTTRVRFVEEVPRWQPPDILEKKGLQGGLATLLSSSDSRLPSSLKSLDKSSYVAIGIADDSKSILVIHLSPFKIELYRGNDMLMIVNERSLLHYEVRGAAALNSVSDTESIDSSIDRHGGKEVIDYGEDGLAIYADGTKEERREIAQSLTSSLSTTESFGGHIDTMPYGPQSVGIDVSFPFAQHVYGLPEHTSPLSLPTTTTGSAEIAPRYHEPYRLYNLDVFEYELDETMALYGHIPFLMGHGVTQGKGISAGVLWFNPSEAFVDISDGGVPTSPYKQSHWIFESGMIDLFLFTGPSPKQVLESLTAISGRQAMPPIFALGYHQCRWNYRDEKDVALVEQGFEDLDFPMDVIWLDIEHTDGKRYFTWDKHAFPTPIEMQQNISNHGRRMVTIIDPHIKTDPEYHVHKEATNLGLYIKEPDGKTDYKGWCWPGESSYLDFTNSRVRQYWAEQFSLNKYIGSTLDLFTWNDMNEPSVFNGPEVSMRKDMRNLDGVEHREWHNLYGIYMQRATAEGQVLRATASPSYSPRPFVLSRAFWTGSQKYGAIWTGDNKADWGHLKIASPMLLSINIAGLSFAGADIGGFFGDPDSELFTRWFQAGAFTPFFRGHAHHDSKRREPWTYGTPTMTATRHAALLRYSLLPYWYTTFYQAYSKGLPVMRPLFVEFPDDITTYALDDAWMIGESLLVHPVTSQGATSVEVYFPGFQPWYSLETYLPTNPSRGGARVTVPAPIDSIPVYIRGGSIIPRKMRLRRSSKLMFYDPYTLVVALDLDEEAEGYLYIDDETTAAHEHGKYIYQRLVYRNSVLQSINAGEGSGYSATNTVERVVIIGLSRPPKQIILKSSESNTEVTLQGSYDSSSRVLTIKQPGVRVSDSWSISLQ